MDEQEKPTPPAPKPEAVSDAMVERATKAANSIRVSLEDRLSLLPEGRWTAYDEKVARAALCAALSTEEGGE